MMLELFDGTGESPEHVKVGGLGGKHGSQGRVCGFAIEPGASDAGAGQEMRDGLHGVLHFMVAEEGGWRGSAARCAVRCASRCSRSAYSQTGRDGSCYPILGAKADSLPALREIASQQVSGSSVEDIGCGIL